jgi:cation diffusion facilitator CzcD-associated flavoprotein CzcO
VSEQPDFRVAIVGAGFSGLGAAIRLKQRGVEDFVILEKAAGVGGTWWANTYPGCQCDVASNLYSLSAAPNSDWTRTYSHQPEIQAYLESLIERFDLASQLRLGNEVLGADWDEDEMLWRLETTSGALTARFLIGGIGPLSEPALPDVTGLESFEGTIFHSARWDHAHDLRGERVAVVGTGASAIQFLPRIQPHARQIHLFQRTPPWVMPHPDRPITRLERWLYRAIPALHRANRLFIYLSREWMALGLTRHRWMLAPLRGIGRMHLRRQVRDPELRRKLEPSYELGCKRILVSDDWYPALTEPNVEVIDKGIAEVRPRSVVAADGTEREVDTIILGTGFRVTDFLGARVIRGVGGKSLAERWNGSPRAFLGTAIADFPNFFMLLGPNTGLGHNSVVYMIESQLEHVMRCLDELERRGAASVEVTPEAQERFNQAVQERMPPTVWNSGGCASWYIDRTGVNSTIWPGLTWRFRLLAKAIRPDDYRFEPAPAQPAAPVPAQEVAA